MKPAPFKYVAPETLPSALESLAQHGFEAKLIAGGQSLLPAMNFRLLQPAVLVDLNPVHELDFVQKNGGGLRIGAMTRQARLERDTTVAQAAPLLHETMPHIAHWQIRNRGTIGGSLAHADPAAELPVIMVALKGRFLLRSATAERWVEAADFFLGVFTTALADDEILTEISIPSMAARTGWSFQEFARRKGDYALLGVAAVLTLNQDGLCDDARLVYLNAAEVPYISLKAADLLVGEKPSPELYDEAVEASLTELRPTANINASVPYLRHLARVLTTRALQQAHERAAAGVGA